MIRKSLKIAESDYKEYKLLNQLEQAQFLLTADWNQINEERKELGLPKISNDAQRKAYQRDKFKDNNELELQKELKYNNLLREYEDEKFKRFLQMHTTE